MVFNATFNNISVISRQSVLLVEESGVPQENKLYHITLVSMYINQLHIIRHNYLYKLEADHPISHCFDMFA
jgi:hypothetical protein